MKSLLIIIALLFSFGQTLQAQFAIVGNEDLAENQLTVEELRDIFSGEDGTWDNGDKIKFSERKDDTSYLMEFYKELGLHRTFFKQHRVKNVSKDASRLGSLFSSDERILTFVSENSGAIGVVSETAANLFSGSVKILEIEQEVSENVSSADKK